MVQKVGGSQGWKSRPTGIRSPDLEVVKRLRGKKKDEARDKDGKGEEIMNGMNWKVKKEGSEKEFKKKNV